MRRPGTPIFYVPYLYYLALVTDRPDEIRDRRKLPVWVKRSTQTRKVPSIARRSSIGTREISHLDRILAGIGRHHGGWLLLSKQQQQQQQQHHHHSKEGSIPMNRVARKLCLARASQDHQNTASHPVTGALESVFDRVDYGCSASYQSISSCSGSFAT